MSYPSVDRPYGLIPQNLIGGQVFAGSTRMIPIASGYTTGVSGGGLFFGDPVKFTNTGTLITSGLAYNSAAAEVGGTLGIFLGCEYSPVGGPIYGKIRSQYWANGTVAPDAVAYVCDDPDVIMKAAVISYTTGSTITAGAVSALSLGTNVSSMATNTANTGVNANTAGNSNVGVMGGSGNARLLTTTPFRIVQLVEDTKMVTQSTGSASSGSSALTLTAANADIRTGMLVTGTNIAAGTVVQAVSGTSVTLSAVTGGAITAGTLTFVGYPEVLLKWNFGYHAYQVAVAI
jgi:hypothetical protein